MSDLFLTSREFSTQLTNVPSFSYGSFSYGALREKGMGGGHTQHNTAIEQKQWFNMNSYNKKNNSKDHHQRANMSQHPQRSCCAACGIEPIL